MLGGAISITTKSKSGHMDHRELFFVAHIADFGMQGKQEQCAAYVKRLIETLDANGTTEAAERLRKLLQGQKIRPTKVSRAGISESPRIPIDAESALGIADHELVEPGSVPLVLSNEDNATITQFIQYLRESGKLRTAGVAVTPSLLIYGPPGCGKTCVAKYIAGELGLPLITARSDGLISSFLGSTSKNVRKLFDYARTEPCVLFLDEFDAIAKKRDDSRELGELKRVVISLLQNIDAFDGEHVLVAATNHEHLLDPAIWRRFAYKLKLDLPGDAARKHLLRMFLSGRLPESIVDLLSPLAEGLSGAQIRLATEEALRSSIIRNEELGGEAIAKGLLREKGVAPESRVETICQMNIVNPEHFSPTTISRILGVSQPYVSKILNKERSGA
jgi:SpoVK/Ycf46/Vps4 family AAA+-type ATPase